MSNPIDSSSLPYSSVSAQSASQNPLLKTSLNGRTISPTSVSSESLEKVSSVYKEKIEGNGLEKNPTQNTDLQTRISTTITSDVSKVEKGLSSLEDNPLIAGESASEELHAQKSVIGDVEKEERREDLENPEVSYDLDALYDDVFAEVNVEEQSNQSEESLLAKRQKPSDQPRIELGQASTAEIQGESSSQTLPKPSVNSKKSQGKISEKNEPNVLDSLEILKSINIESLINSIKNSLEAQGFKYYDEDLFEKIIVSTLISYEKDRLPLSGNHLADKILINLFKANILFNEQGNPLTDADKEKIKTVFRALFVQLFISLSRESLKEKSKHTESHTQRDEVRERVKDTNITKVESPLIDRIVVDGNKFGNAAILKLMTSTIREEEAKRERIEQEKDDKSIEIQKQILAKEILDKSIKDASLKADSLKKNILSSEISSKNSA